MATRLRILGVALIAALLPASGLTQQHAAARAIAGKVVDASGAAVADADVVLRWRLHPELPMAYGHSLSAVRDGDVAAPVGLGELGAKSDARGRFRLEPPHRGPFLLIAFGEGRADSSARVFPVMHGSFHELQLEPSFFMAGRVLAADGSAVAGAQVRLAPTALQWERAGIYNEPERRSATVSDARGRFRLLFEHGYLRSPRWDILMTPLAVAGERSSCANLLPLRPVQSARDCSLVLGATPSMRGKVSDQQAKPLAGAVTFDPALPGSSASTDEHGRFAVPVCSGRLWVHKRGFAPVSLAGQYGAENNAVLMPGRVLQVRLADARGPLAKARVLWVWAQSSGVGLEWTGMTDEHGKIEVRGLPSGGPLLGFVEVEGRFRRCFAEMVTGDAKRELLLANGTAVRGQVVSSTGQPLAGVRVALWPKLDVVVLAPYITYTDHGGRFAFDPVAGAHSLAVDAGQLGVVSLLVAATELGRRHVLKLPATPGVSGQVLDADGKPAPGAWVSISRMLSPDGSYAPSPRLAMQAFCMLADDEGRFAFTGLPAGAVWNAVGALLREDVKYNGRASVQTGGEVTLRVAVEQQ